MNDIGKGFAKYVVMIGPSKELARGGMASVVNAYSQANLFDIWPIIYIETHRETSALHKLFLLYSALFKFISLLWRNKVSILHAHVAMRKSFLRKSLFMLMARFFGVPYILHLHGSEFKVFYENESGAFKRWYIRFIFNQAAAIIALSEEWRKWIASISSNQNIRLIHNPVQLPDKGTLIDTVLPQHNVLFLGRLGTRKGIADLLKAFVKVVAQSKHPVHLWCGGDGDREMVEQLLLELNLTQHVSVMGWIQGNEKQSLLREADVLVLPSYNEGLPMAILEALAYGVPVVATNIGGIPDAITHGAEGYLINPGDIDALAESILAIVSNQELRAIMRKNARLKAENCFEDKMIVSKISSLYAEIIGGQHAAG